MLTLVHPAPRGQGTDLPRKRGYRTRRPILTPEQEARIRAVLQNLRRAYGGWDVLAEVMGYCRGTVKDAGIGHHNISPGILVRAARAAGTTVEALLAPLSPAD